MITDLSKRAHDHNYEHDWIVRSLLDTDMYKFLMMQFIWKVERFRKTEVQFGLINRTQSIPLAKVIDEVELRAQLDHVRTLRIRHSEAIWLAGNTFYGQTGIFEPDFLRWLEEDFRLPPYQLKEKDGQWDLSFEGPWAEVTLWEIYALEIVSELRARAGLKRMNEMDIDIFYANAKAKIWHKVSSLVGIPGFSMADMGTRRRFGHLWQDYVVQMQRAKLGKSYVGTSNMLMAFRHDLTAIGTNAHELPMVAAVLARLGKIDSTLKDSQYLVPKLWQKYYPPALGILLPDTYGSKQFWDNASDELILNSAGARLDSGEPFHEVEIAMNRFEDAGANLLQKLFLPSDGLNPELMMSLHANFMGDIRGDWNPNDFKSGIDFQNPKHWKLNPRAKMSMGIGTDQTCDVTDCAPIEIPEFEKISLVCKVLSADGHPAVKLSNNITKATGPKEEIELYKQEFGVEGQISAPVYS